MKRFHKYSLQIAAVAILAVVLTLAAPRAVHAVAAALVNVTNTAASPAISQSVNQLASQNVFLTTNVSIIPGQNVSMLRELPDGSIVFSAFVVPSGQSLVITSIDVLPSGSNGTSFLTVNNMVTTYVRKYLRVPANSSQFQYPSGIVFPAGESIQIFTNAGNTSSVFVEMHGYLTSN
jgi:hypothetical protein